MSLGRLKVLEFENKNLGIWTLTVMLTKIIVKFTTINFQISNLQKIMKDAADCPVIGEHLTRICLTLALKIQPSIKHFDHKITSLCRYARLHH